MDEIIQKLSRSKDISFGCFVNGKLINSDEYKNAIDSCNTAFEIWKNNPNRSAILKNVSTLLTSKVASFIKVASYGSYKYNDSIKDDIEYASRGFLHFSKLAQKYSVNNQLVARGALGGVILEDCALFSALTWLTAVPLAAGNSIVLLIKPSYSIIALCFAAVLHEAGVPPGVVNVIPFVDEECFPTIACHFPRVIGIIPQTISSSDDFHFSSVLIKKHSLLPMLVSKSADIDAVVDSFVSLTQNHEVLWHPNVVFVEEPVFEKFVKSLKFFTLKYNLRIEIPKEYDVKYSAVLNNFIKEKKGQGYELIILIHRFCNCIIILNHDGAINTPIIVDENKTTHHVVSVLPIRSLQEGISAVNNNNSGLAVSFWSNDAVEVNTFPFSLQYGTVWVNCAGYFNPSIPFSPWNSFGYGTFSGKRALYEHFTEPASTYKVQIESFYPAERNLIFSKKDISSVINKSLEVQSLWSKLEIESKLMFIENVATLMDKNWTTHFKIVLDQTTESQWKNSVSYLNFWANYPIEKIYQKMMLADGCRVLCESEPIGIIGIMAGCATLDIILFLIGAALAYGNSVVVGLSSDEKTSITGTELENIFSAKGGLVSVIVNDSNLLWQQLILNKNIASLWLIKNYCKRYLKNCSFKNIIGIEPRTDMTTFAELFEIYSTKQKSVWLPSL